MDRVRKVTGRLIDEEQGGFRAGGVDQIFTLKQIGENAREKTQSVRGFHIFGKGIR